MPALDSVREIVPFTSPTKRTYRIIKTDERDAYDIPSRPEMKKPNAKKRNRGPAK